MLRVFLLLNHHLSTLPVSSEWSVAEWGNWWPSWFPFGSFWILVNTCQTKRQRVWFKRNINLATKRKSISTAHKSNPPRTLPLRPRKDPTLPTRAPVALFLFLGPFVVLLLRRTGCERRSMVEKGWAPWSPWQKGGTNRFEYKRIWRFFQAYIVD